MWHDLFRVALLIMLMVESFKCHKHLFFCRYPILWMKHRWQAFKISHPFHSFQCLSSVFSLSHPLWHTGTEVDVFLHPFNRNLLLLLLLILLLLLLLIAIIITLINYIIITFLLMLLLLLLLSISKLPLPLLFLMKQGCSEACRSSKSPEMLKVQSCKFKKNW